MKALAVAKGITRMHYRREWVLVPKLCSVILSKELLTLAMLVIKKIQLQGLVVQTKHNF